MSKYTASTFTCRRIIHKATATNDRSHFHPSESPRGIPAQTKIAYHLHLGGDTSSRDSRPEQGRGSNPYAHRQDPGYVQLRREVGRGQGQYVGRTGEDYRGDSRQEYRRKREFEREQDRYEEERNRQLDEEDCGCDNCKIQRRARLTKRVHAWLARTEEIPPRRK